jgi:hypothetical protein
MSEDWEFERIMMALDALNRVPNERWSSQDAALKEKLLEELERQTLPMKFVPGPNQPTESE